jgi:hypothetical protein
VQEYVRQLSERLFDSAPRHVRWHIDVDPIEYD